jgi:hypothetical protein
MNLFNIIDEIEKVDPEFQDRISPRRAAIKNMAGFGSKVAVAALPLALSGLFKKAYAGTSAAADVNGVLNFALQLEYFESAFYNAGVEKAVYKPADAAYFTAIKAHEANHVTFLQSVLGSAALPQPAANSYDFTAGGTFADVLSNYKTYYAVAQVLEDTGVRAYKGQAPNLAGNKVVLTAALGIHAVEARHASAIRYLRYLDGSTNAFGNPNTPWIAGSASVSNDTGISAVDGNYAGENTSSQLGVDITKLPSASGSSTSVGIAAAAFDEYLTKDAVAALVKGFGVNIV